MWWMTNEGDLQTGPPCNSKAAPPLYYRSKPCLLYTSFNRDPDRDRRLLMHKREIRKLHALVKQDGYTLVPLSVYFKNAKVKVEVGLCKGKKNYDKRDATAKRDAAREMDRAMKARR